MNYTMTEENLNYDFILENELVSKEALDLGLACGGNDMDTYNYIIYYSTGYHDVEQLWECEKDNYYFNDDIKEYYGLGEEEDDEDEIEEINKRNKEILEENFVFDPNRKTWVPKQ